MLRGPYQPTFDTNELFEDWIDEIDVAIKRQEIDLEAVYEKDDKTLPTMHKKIMARFYKTIGDVSNIRSHTTCLCCVRKIPNHILPCGHILCKACIQSFGSQVGQSAFELESCPLHPTETRWSSPARLRFKPQEAGVRVLCLDG